MSSESDLVPVWLRKPAAYAWRLMVIGLLLVLVARAVKGVQVVVVALFIALVIAAILKPLVDVFDRVMPRPLATVFAFVCGLAVLGGLGTFVGVSVAGQWDSLSHRFVDGVEQIDRMLKLAPWPLNSVDFAQAGEAITNWISDNQDELIAQALARAGDIAGALTALILGLFCAVFFTASGGQMFHWFLSQLPSARAVHRWGLAAGVAWRTFSGYVRGIGIVAATNGLLAGIGLAILGVPLAAPVGVLVFLGTFVPIIGATLSMTVAIVIALAARGPVIALVVVALITLIGQVEGHLLQPMIMAKQVSLHPVVVAVTVVAGTVVAGILGAVAAVPLVSVAWAVFSRLRVDSRVV